MDHFDQEQLKELIEASSPPAISIYIPFERTELTKKSTRLLFRSAVDDARALLSRSEQQNPKVWEPLIEQLEERLSDPTIWNGPGHGLAMFAAPGFARTYHLPITVEKTVVVSTNFHTRPLLELMASPERYWVLAIGQDEVALWEGNSTGLTKMPLGDIPTSMSEVLQLEEEKGQDPLVFHSSFRHSMGREVHHAKGTRGLPSPVYDGSGGGIDRQDAYMKEFFLRVDEGVQKRIGEQDGPLILAAVDYHHPMYQENSGLKNLAPEGIHGNVHYWSEKQLHEEAWPIARQVADQKIREALELWERSYGLGGAEGDPGAIGQLIIEGRVHLLLVDKDCHLWGHYDLESGGVEVTQREMSGELSAEGDPDAEAMDILDEFAEQVILRGGKALLVSSQMMPTETGVAAILRGNKRPATSFYEGESLR